MDEWTVSPEEDGQALAGFVRARLGGRPWTQVKKLIATGKVFVDGHRVTIEGRRMRAGERVELRMSAPRAREHEHEVRIVHEDTHVVVIDKPAGVSSVPYEEKESGTAMDLLRDAWRRQGRPATETALHVVHRIDKDTSGLLVFAKSKKAERELAAQFRAHAVDRKYLCVAHGRVASGRIESRLVEDRGDGLRGSTRFPDQGKTAITHVTAVRALAGATLCEVRLETGKTHQIRIHLAERGHPLVGERVYVRDHEQAGRPVIASPRLLLHAATLGFVHPVTGERLAFESPLPPDFQAVVDRLAR
jgi:23S rRNA pseudouridine1911/1915/1917 synthase